jgi:hypothetical protein
MITMMESVKWPQLRMENSQLILKLESFKAFLVVLPLCQETQQ